MQPNASAVDLLTEFADINGRRHSTWRICDRLLDAKLIPPLSPCRGKVRIKSRANPKNLILTRYTAQCYYIFRFDMVREKIIFIFINNYVFSIKCKRNKTYLLHYY